MLRRAVPDLHFTYPKVQIFCRAGIARRVAGNKLSNSKLRGITPNIFKIHYSSSATSNNCRCMVSDSVGIKRTLITC
jgi:hypothetical protein